MSAGDGVASCDRNCGNRSSRSCHIAPAPRDTARPLFGDTKPRSLASPVAAQRSQIEPEAKLGQHLQFETHHLDGGGRGVVELIENSGEMVMHLRMRIALRQQPAQRRKMGYAIHHVRSGKLRGAMQAQRLDNVVAEVLVQPGPPDHPQRVARLQHRPQPRAATAANQAEVAAVPARHRFQDGIGLAMAPRAEHDARRRSIPCPSLSQSRMSPQRRLSASGRGSRRIASWLSMTKQAGRSAGRTDFDVAQR